MKRVSGGLVVVLAAGWAALGGAAQHDMQHMGRMAMSRHAANVRLAVENDAREHILTVRFGPLDLPARAGMDVAQAPDLTFALPVEGWLTAYYPSLVDANGHPLPSRLLHHVAFYNTQRSDLLCPGKPEHIFGAGGEMGAWPPIPGFGYRVRPGDRIRVTSMFHNDTPTPYPQTFFVVKIHYQPAEAGGAALKSVYPVWFDVKGCGPSGYDLPPGRTVRADEFRLAYSGVLLGVGGHLHDYGEQLQLVDLSRHDRIATLNARLAPDGHLVSIPVVKFVAGGGFPLSKGDLVKVRAVYDNPVGHVLPEGAMGIVVGYFLPSDDRAMAALDRHAGRR